MASPPASLRAVRVHQNLARLPRLQPLHALGEIFHCDAIRDHRVQVELAGFQQRGHLVPGLIHAAAVDALDGDPLEDDVLGEIQRDGLGGQPEERDAPAAAHDVECRSDGARVAGHLEDDIHAKSACSLQDETSHVFFRRIEREVRLHFFSNVAAVFIDLDGIDLCGAYRSSNRDRKESDRPAAGNGDGFRGYFPGQYGVHGVAEWIQDRGVLVRDGGIEFPDVRLGNDYVFGECAIKIHADDFHVLTNVGLARSALQALAAGHVHFGGDKVACLDARDFVAVSNHFATELVPGNERRMDATLCPAVPLVDVQVGAADGGDFDFHQDLGATVARNLDFSNIRTGCGLRFHHRQHGIGHQLP